jgi:hypothetical protein
MIAGIWVAAAAAAMAAAAILFAFGETVAGIAFVAATGQIVTYIFSFLV